MRLSQSKFIELDAFILLVAMTRILRKRKFVDKNITNYLGMHQIEPNHKHKAQEVYDLFYLLPDEIKYEILLFMWAPCQHCRIPLQTRVYHAKTKANFNYNDGIGTCFYFACLCPRCMFKIRRVFIYTNETQLRWDQLYYEKKEMDPDSEEASRRKTDRLIRKNQNEIINFIMVGNVKRKEITCL